MRMEEGEKMEKEMLMLKKMGEEREIVEKYVEGKKMKEDIL